MSFWMLALAATLDAAAIEPPPLTWDALDARIDAAWAEGPGRAADARHDGAREARAATALPLSSLFVQLQPDPSGTRHPLDGTQVAVQVDVGARYATERRLWEARAARLLAEDDAAHLAFAGEVQLAWLGWWVAHAMGHHLAEYATSLDARIAPLRAAAAAGVVAPAAVADLDAELARLVAESIELEVQAGLLRGEVGRMLGGAVVLSDQGVPDPESLDRLPDNPWPALVDAVASHPAVRALAARADEVRAEARAAAGSYAVQVGVGAGFTDAGGGTLLAAPLLLLDVPLGHREAPGGRQARAEAEALDVEQAWRLRELQAWVQGEADAFDAAAARVRTLTERVEGPLQARHDRLLAALAQGAVDVPALALASRDLHEAHHAHAVAVADLWAREARARALAAHIATTRSTP